jgi:hypothetical protein
VKEFIQMEVKTLDLKLVHQLIIESNLDSPFHQFALLLLLIYAIIQKVTVMD